MRFKMAGNKADKIISVVRNGETSVAIPRGAPVVLKLSTTAADNDGLDVVLASTAGSPLSAALRFGVALTAIAAGDFGEVVRNGIMPYALVTRATRAASSDSWTSSASIASGIGLGLDIVAGNNAFILGGASAAGSVVSGPDAVLLDSIASMAASASATSDTRTAITIAARVFVRML